MKKILKNKIILMVILCVLSCGIGITASNIYQSNSIEYSPTDSSWEVSNVNEALNELYSISKNSSSNFTITFKATSLVQSNTNNFVPSGGERSVIQTINCVDGVCDYTTASSNGNFKPDSVSNNGSFKLSTYISDISIVFND